jgi:hypothetical protein
VEKEKLEAGEKILNLEFRTASSSIRRVRGWKIG